MLRLSPPGGTEFREAIRVGRRRSPGEAGGQRAKGLESLRHDNRRSQLSLGCVGLPPDCLGPYFALARGGKLREPATR
jgi:hypothetical protein